jgi:hypothetical protein
MESDGMVALTKLLKWQTQFQTRLGEINID